MMIIEKYRILT